MAEEGTLEFELCTTEPEDDVLATSSGSAPELLYMDGKQWPNEGNGNIILKVFFVQKPPPETNEEKILTVMREWSKHCGIRFVRTNYLRESDIRITFEKGYSCSAIGTDARLPCYKERQTMNLGWVNERTILHETGHALGLVHEHQHPEGKIDWDIQKLIEDLVDKGPKWSLDQVKKNIITPHKKNEVKGTRTMDSDSIMAYQIREEWVKNATDPAIKQLFKFNTKLSTLDKKTISEMYPKPTIDMDSDDENTAAEETRVESDASEMKPHQWKANGSTSESAAFPHTSLDHDSKSVGASKDKQPDFVFGKDHLSKLFLKLLPQASSWKTIGQVLGVPRLNTIESNYAKVDDCLREMLSTWLKQIRPPPMKEKLIEALNAISDHTLADEINTMFP